MTSISETGSEKSSTKSEKNSRRSTTVDADVDNPISGSLLSIIVYLESREIGKNIKNVLTQKIAYQIEGRCIKDGFVVPNSVSVFKHSTGKKMGAVNQFAVDYECKICLPFIGMKIKCVVISVTLAGIHAQYIWENWTVMDMFVMRDDNYSHPDYNSIQEKYTAAAVLNEEKKPIQITVEVKGVWFELNDRSIAAVGHLI
jgi:hypothetical protein